MPAARPASLTPSTPYTTPAHRSLVHHDLSTLARAGSGLSAGHLKRTRSPLATAQLPSYRCVRLPKRGDSSPLTWLALLSTLRRCSVLPPSFAARGSSPSPTTHDTRTHALSPKCQLDQMDPSSTTVPSTYFFDPHMNLPQKSLHHNISYLTSKISSKSYTTTTFSLQLCMAKTQAHHRAHDGSSER